MVSIRPHHSQLGSGIMWDLKALLLVQTVLLSIWKAVSLVLKARTGSRSRRKALLKLRWSDHMAILSLILVLRVARLAHDGLAYLSRNGFWRKACMKNNSFHEQVLPGLSHQFKAGYKWYGRIYHNWKTTREMWRKCPNLCQDTLENAPKSSWRPLEQYIGDSLGNAQRVFETFSAILSE
jgi:hypothetical protein